MSVRSTLTIEPHLGGIRIVAPVHRSPLVIGFLGFWLCGWACGEVAMVRAALLREEASLGHGPVPFLAPLTFWAFAGLLACASLAWNLFGREEIVADGRTLSIRVAVGGLGRTRRYDLAKVRNVREDRESLWSWGRRFRPTVAGRVGTLVFDYGRRQVWMGVNVRGAQVPQVLEVLRGRVPSLPNG